MEFKLLGAVEVVIGGESIALTSRRQEIVLAMLLLEANNTVSLERLIDALWDDGPPSSARSQVHILISALRRLLGDEVIITRPPGYSIQIDEQVLDLVLFESLMAKSTEAAARRRIADAAGFLRSALALWRGRAVDGVESAVIRASARRLEERRISATQACLDYELQLGKHHDLIGELTELVNEYPLDERFRSQLMLALHRAGRPADALEAFRTGRDIVREELGLDPSGMLYSLQQSILSGDAEVDLNGGGHLSWRSGVDQLLGAQQAEITDLRSRIGMLEQALSEYSPHTRLLWADKRLG